MTDYLPKAATIEQACDWLAKQTGSAWSLARLLECGTKPWFWLDYSTDAPKEIFGDKTEGYLAPMIFAGDTHRLELYGEFALVTMTRTHDDNLFKLTPGMRLDLSEIRFKRESLERVAKIINGQNKCQPAVFSGVPESAEPPAHVSARPLPAQRFQEQEILRVIGELGYDAKALPKNPNGTKGVKAKVRKIVPLNTPGIFDGAWERLRATGEIQDAT